jgi:hypothetical protein
MKFFSLFLLASASFALFSLHGAELSPGAKEYISHICKGAYFYLQDNAREDLDVLRSERFATPAVDSFFNALLTNRSYFPDLDCDLQSAITDINNLVPKHRSVAMDELSRKLARTDKEVMKLEIRMRY